MGYEAVMQLASEALRMCLLLSLPAVLTASIVGLLVAFVSAITSLQDSSISQGIKLLAVTIVVLIAVPWAAATMLRFADKALSLAFQ